MSESRIYRVTNSALLDSHPPRLIVARNAAEALRHVCAPYEAKAVSAMELADLQQRFGDQIEVEKVKE